MSKIKKFLHVADIEKNIEPFVIKLCKAMLKDRPDNVALYMKTWLQNYGHYTSTGLTKEEKSELESLRKEIKRYRELDDEMGKEKEENSNEEESDDDDDKVDEIDYNLDNAAAQRKLSLKKKRSAVSAEVYSLYSKDTFKPRVINKTEEQKNKIKVRLLRSFLFGSLEPKDLDSVIGAMEEKKYVPKSTIIKQGDQGDCMYILEEGKCECFIKLDKNQEPKKVKNYIPGEVFGELALLYNAPRAATVISTTNVITWALDRETFNHIVKGAAQKKREKYEKFLKKVEILSTIEEYEIMQISDALKCNSYLKGDFIIKEGEMGDVFYILEEGECEATKVLEPAKPATVIKEYKPGDYFGERALIKGEPRYANIIAKSETVKVISLDRDTFKRLCGPIEEILKRNMEKYEVFIKK